MVIIFFCFRFYDDVLWLTVHRNVMSGREIYHKHGHILFLRNSLSVKYYKCGNAEEISGNIPQIEGL